MLTVCTCSRKTHSSSNTMSRRLTRTRFGRVWSVAASPRLDLSLRFRQCDGDGHIPLVSFLSGCFKSLCDGLERVRVGSEPGLVVTYCDQRGAVFSHSSQNRSLGPKPAANQSSRLWWRVFISEAFNTTTTTTTTVE